MSYEMESITMLISNVGFPIVIALYFILKTERVIRNNTIAITEMKTLIKERLK